MGTGGTRRSIAPWSRWATAASTRTATPDRVDPGFWSGDLEGSLLTGDWPWNTTHDVWEEAADKLFTWIAERWGRLEGKLTIIAHSHGGQIAAYASRRLARKSMLIEHLVTVDTPLRRDMDKVWLDAIGGYKRWTHMHSNWGWGSRMRWLGARTLPWKRAQNGSGDHQHPDTGSQLGAAKPLLPGSQETGQPPGHLASGAQIAQSSSLSRMTPPQTTSMAMTHSRASSLRELSVPG